MEQQEDGVFNAAAGTEVEANDAAPEIFLSFHIV